MSIIDRFGSVRVLCIGDVMIDRFIGGDVRRISPESPVPVISIEKAAAVPGGAANVARNVTALGGRCTLIGLIGRDDAGRDLMTALERDEAISIHLIRSDERPTTEKMRFIAQGQHIIRADRECADEIDARTEDALLSVVAAVMRDHQVVVASDYAKGLVTDHVIEEIMRMARQGRIPVLVDPKSPCLARYAGATLITPNAKELHAATGVDPSSENAVVEAAQKVLSETEIDGVLVTRAEKGMMLVTREGGSVHIAAAAREVSDVVGAGDTVIATLSLAVGAGAALGEAARLANIAAGVVVGKHGTATLTRTELLDELSQRDRLEQSGADMRLLSWTDATSRIALWRRDGLRIGFTNGCFDILHIGHLELLNFARSNCDRLIVGLNSDASVRRLKGPLRPINTQSDRARLISALSMVDAVILFDQDTPKELIERVMPDVLVKGADYDLEEIVGADFVLAGGGAVLRCELTRDRSTTRVLELMANGSVG